MEPEAGAKSACPTSPNSLAPLKMRTQKKKKKNEDSQGAVMSKVLSSVLQSTLAQWVKTLPAMQETQKAWVQSPGLGGSSGRGNGNPLQYSCLENPMDRGA